ncbi:unnamed protein product [Caenorhabditis angaria]|uniref:DDE Tnp4 domain-containing protein n=1 Tax=Caenorhabditis angaria TaxID=860376 RepID=A0A9P1J0Q6_9PELO|nr:unnamed protein product [Caenorhabditis angaria]
MHQRHVLYNSSKHQKRKKIEELRRLFIEFVKFTACLQVQLNHFCSKELILINKRSFVAFQEQILSHIRIRNTKRVIGLNFNQLMKLYGVINEREKCKAPKIIRIAIFLLFSKNGVSQHALAIRTGLSQTTIHRIIQECSTDLIMHARDLIKWPSNDEIITQENYCLSISKGFRAFASIDGKHFRIDHPPNSGVYNRNYKQYFSFNTLFISDFNRRIIYMQICNSGQNSDAQLFAASPLKGFLENPNNLPPLRNLPNTTIPASAYILGDGGFKLMKQVITPYRRLNMTPEKAKFNTELSKIRVRVEHLFGVVTSKYRCFRKNLELAPSNAQRLIAALSVLHNLTLRPKIYATQNQQIFPPIIDPYKTANEFRDVIKSHVNSF